MKKYIIGLFSAICLMGAGCTEFELYAGGYGRRSCRNGDG